MICQPCTQRRHDECRYPDNCPCHHLSAEESAPLLPRPETVADRPTE